MENGKEKKQHKLDRKLQQKDNNSMGPQRHSLVYWKFLFQNVPAQQWLSTRSQVSIHSFWLWPDWQVCPGEKPWQTFSSNSPLPGGSLFCPAFFGCLGQPLGPKYFRKFHSAFLRFWLSSVVSSRCTVIKALRVNPACIWVPSFFQFCHWWHWQKLCCLLDPSWSAWSPDYCPLRKLRILNSSLWNFMPTSPCFHRLCCLLYLNLSNFSSCSQSEHLSTMTYSKILVFCFSSTYVF